MSKKRLAQFRSDRQVLNEAMSVARSFCEAEPISSRMCEFQGMFSKSAIVTLSDDTEVVVQLKDNEIDSTKTVLANTLLGDVVPICYGAVTNATFAYVSRFVPGTVWLLHRKLDVDSNARIARQLGSLLARCTLGLDSTSMVDRYVVPRLHNIISKADMPDLLRTRIRELLSLAEGLKALPLALTHTDVNQMNIILDEEATIAGLIDWELAQLLPLGMNASRIRDLAVVNKDRVDYLSEKTQPIAEAFWDGFVTSLSERYQGLKQYIVDAMMVGLVLNTFGEGWVPDPRDVAMTMKRLEWIENTFGALAVAKP